MKYLELNSGVQGEGATPATRDGIIYDKSGHIIWSSHDVKPRLSSQEVSHLFESLHTSLGKF